jgi:hypothetical protein
MSKINVSTTYPEVNTENPNGGYRIGCTRLPTLGQDETPGDLVCPAPCRTQPPTAMASEIISAMAAAVLLLPKTTGCLSTLSFMTDASRAIARKWGERPVVRCDSESGDTGSFCGVPQFGLSCQVPDRLRLGCRAWLHFVS